MSPIGQYVVLAVFMRKDTTFSYLFGPSAYLKENRLSIMDTNHMYVFLHLNCLLFLSGFEQSRKYGQKFSKNPKYKFSGKFRVVQNGVVACRKMGVQRDEFRDGLWNCSAYSPKSDKITLLKVRYCFD